MNKTVNTSDTVNDLYQWQEQGKDRVFLCISGDPLSRDNMVTVGLSGNSLMLRATMLAAMMVSNEVKELFLWVSKFYAESKGNGLYEQFQDMADEAMAEALMHGVISDKDTNDAEA